MAQKRKKLKEMPNRKPNIPGLGFLELSRTIEKGMTPRPWGWEYCGCGCTDAIFIAFARNVWPELTRTIDAIEHVHPRCDDHTCALCSWRDALDAVARKGMSARQSGRTWKAT